MKRSVVVVVAAVCVLLGVGLVLLLTRPGSDEAVVEEPPQTAAPEPPDEARPSLAKIKDALDRSVRESLGGTYLHHDELVDADGKAKAYSFAYFVGAGDPPSPEELARSLASARAKQEKGRRLMAEGRANNDVEMMKLGAKRLRNGAGELLQAKRFVSIEIGATYDSPPIRMFRRGLTPSVIYRFKARQLAQKHCRTDSIIFGRLLYKSLGQVIFQYEHPNGDSVFVDPLSAKTSPHCRPVPRSRDRELDTRKDMERWANMRARWAQFLSGPIDFRVFNKSRQKEVGK